MRINGVCKPAVYNRGLQTKPQCGTGVQAPDQEVRGKVPEAESFLGIKC